MLSIPTQGGELFAPATPFSFDAISEIPIVALCVMTSGQTSFVSNVVQEMFLGGFAGQDDCHVVLLHLEVWDSVCYIVNDIMNFNTQQK